VWGVDRLWLVEGEEKKVRSRGGRRSFFFLPSGGSWVFSKDEFLGLRFLEFLCFSLTRSKS